LVETEPAEGGTLGEPPEQVRLRFDEPVEAAFEPIKVYDQQGNRVDEDNARADPDDAKALVVGLQELSDGSYTVEWRVTSIDGHVVDGTYKFAVASAGGSPAVVQADDDDVKEPDSAPQEGAEGGSTHVVHGVALGLGALVILALALLRRR
jgi:MYXO-CTERM domain-containing protein